MDADEPITVVLSRRVRPGREAEFEGVLARVAREALKFPGHQGVSVLRPVPGGRSIYTIVVHFRSKREWEAWEASPIRAQLLAEAEKLSEGGLEVRQVSGLEGWFQMPGSPVIVPPPRQKMAFVTWLAIFPILLVFNLWVLPWLAWIPFLLRLALVSGVTIYLMTYVVMPQMTRLFRRWLYMGST